MAYVKPDAKIHDVTVQDGECKNHGYATEVGKVESYTWDDTSATKTYKYTASQWKETPTQNQSIETTTPVNLLT